METIFEMAGDHRVPVTVVAQETKGDGIQFNLPKDQSVGIIKVLGVGGGGCNAVRNMWLDGIENVTYAVCNTDSQQLVKSPVPVKLQLGADGLGAGGNPDKGRKEAECSSDRIKELLSDGTKMVFVTASMGGGTGTGAGPIVARVAKEMGILTIGIVTIPFSFEGHQKIIRALQGMEEMRDNVDALLVVQNDKLTGTAAKDDNGQPVRVPMKAQFKQADNILKDAAKSISELITLHTEGDINLDFCDVETTMKNGGDAIMAAGRASGEHRVERAILQALDSPLLYGSDIGRAQRILFDIYTSDDEPLYIDEMNEIDDFMQQLDSNISVIWGTSTDNSLGSDVKVIILAAGMERQMQTEPVVTVQKDDAYYRSLMQQLYAPRKPRKKFQDTLFSDDELDGLEKKDDEHPEGDAHAADQHDGTTDGNDGDGASDDESSDEPTHNTQPSGNRTFIEKAKAWLIDLTRESVY